jgi:hypothetical protein
MAMRSAEAYWSSCRHHLLQPQSMGRQGVCWHILLLAQRLRNAPAQSMRAQCRFHALQRSMPCQ